MTAARATVCMHVRVLALCACAVCVRPVLCLSQLPVRLLATCRSGSNTSTSSPCASQSVCVHACVRACARACVLACIHACVRRACVRASCIRACVHACVHACVCVCECARACVRMYMRAYIHACVVCLCACVFLCRVSPVAAPYHLSLSTSQCACVRACVVLGACGDCVRGWVWVCLLFLFFMDLPRPSWSLCTSRTAAGPSDACLLFPGRYLVRQMVIVIQASSSNTMRP